VGPESTTRNLEEHLPEGGISVNNLQHISEREPEDCDSDPSLHPCAGTIFMERSKQAIESEYILEVDRKGWLMVFDTIIPSLSFFRWHGEEKESTSNSRYKAFEEK